MQTKGKFYIWLNRANIAMHYWNQNVNDWTTQAKEASFFDTSAEALTELNRLSSVARAPIIGEPVVSKATRDI